MRRNSLQQQTEADNGDEGSLLAIDINTSSSSDEAPQSPKLPRDHQSEAQFLALKKSWKPKIEAGELWKSLKLPVDNPEKPESQKIMHAIEELYFFRRYEEALSITEKALEGVLQEEFRTTLDGYAGRCKAKIESRKD